MQAGGSIIKRLFCIFCVGLVLLISSGVDVFADGNEGQLLSDPIGDIGESVKPSVVNASDGEPVKHYNLNSAKNYNEANDFRLNLP